MAWTKPERYLTRITALDVQEDLVSAGIRAVLLDIDNTIRPRDTKVVPDDVMAWIREAQAAGIRVVLFSNNVHQNVYDLGRDLGLDVVGKAMKPLPFAYGRAFKQWGLRPEECLAIGDQLSTDVWGARLAGAHAVLVTPLCTVDPAHTRIVRAFESLFMGGLVPEGQRASAGAASGE